jgi:signal recognition particle subunit SRP54
MLPGAAQNRELLSQVSDKDLDRAAAIVNSMTPAERRNPKILNGSRRARIAKGAGVTVGEVSNLVVRFLEGQKMMRQMMGGGLPGMPPIPGMRRAAKNAKGRKPAKKKPKGGRPGGAPGRAASGTGVPAGGSAGPGGPAGSAPAGPGAGLGGGGLGGPGLPAGLGGPKGGLPAGLSKPGAASDIAAGLEALAADPAFRKKLEAQLPGDGPASDLPAGFGRFRRGKRGGR